MSGRSSSLRRPARVAARGGPGRTLRRDETRTVANDVAIRRSGGPRALMQAARWWWSGTPPRGPATQPPKPLRLDFLPFRSHGSRHSHDPEHLILIVALHLTHTQHLGTHFHVRSLLRFRCRLLLGDRPSRLRGGHSAWASCFVSVCSRRGTALGILRRLRGRGFPEPALFMTRVKLSLGRDCGRAQGEQRKTSARAGRIGDFRRWRRGAQGDFGRSERVVARAGRTGASERPSRPERGRAQVRR